MALLPVAEYLRMSTDHQEYSLDNQAGSIPQYAGLRGFEVVQTYADPGRSGLPRLKEGNPVSRVPIQWWRSRCSKIPSRCIYPSTERRRYAESALVRIGMSAVHLDRPASGMHSSQLSTVNREWGHPGNCS